MELPLSCTDYDAALIDKLPHLTNYPQLKPFIGNAWKDKTTRILFIGESHYLPKDSLVKNDSENWYNNTVIQLKKRDIEHTNTRGVIHDVERGGEFRKAYVIFYNLKKAITNTNPNMVENNELFHNFGYYNYFQRPAEVNGGSIKNSKRDDEVAYTTLKSVVEVAQPSTIIFLSKKAMDAFWREKSHNKEEKFPKIHSLPHPASAWWNRKHGTPAQSGRDRFLTILESIDLAV